MDHRPPGFCVHGILQARILEWITRLLFPSLGDLPDPGIKSTSPALAGGFITAEPQGEPYIKYICIVFSLFHEVDLKVLEK